MRSFFVSLLILALVALVSSCRKDLEYAPSNGNLEFSKDTIFLDTIYTNLTSSTRTLKVYNRTRDDIEIPSIRLSQGQNSSYRLNVDGVAGKEFEGIQILAQDSIFIFIETTFNVPDTALNEFLYTDAIQFDNGEYLQEVQLVTLIKDAVFLYPKSLPDGSKETVLIGFDDSGNEIRAEGFELEDDQLNFTNQKPYVIYGYAVVPEGKELIVDAGSRVHFHKDSGMLIKSNASLQVNGGLSEDQDLLENEVIFSGDRLESELTNVAGQWGTLWITSGSINNTINYLTLKNATVGLLVDGDGILNSPTLTVTNSQIYNSASVNLWGKKAAINAENVVLGSSGNTSLFLNLGGKYEFAHCTVANYWSNGFRGGTALEIDNFTRSSNGELERAEFFNCIIDGNNAIELVLRNNNTNLFEYSFINCLLKFRDSGGMFDSDPLYDFGNLSLYKEVFINEDANYLNVAKNDFRIENPSAAEGRANIGTALRIPFDLLGIDRTSSPSIGAYQISTQN
ncbi:hypothetical protein FEE95_10610 [Maribacter algarum]|uniref:Right-handed parallel beta-helix repeat-containing protein n=1 Tax=Maribacter algarum (ex Zhang et al. 2020) TaxID=2578118 RepID=A0A5S3PQN6_9FLAO|nr:hypothetical protein [Maribacter algarum]TMM56939.1 hypothetical protein FEE95_10610 [Maribacter algarum]